MRVSANVIPSAFLRKREDGFAMVMALAMVSIIGLSTAAMFNILGPQTKSTVRDVSKLKSGFEARMASEILMKSISDNTSFVSSIMSLDNASNSAVKSEWDTHCQNLFNGELRTTITDAGYSEFRGVGPVRVNGAQVTSYVLPQFFTDQNNDGIDDDGNTGYLIVGCARRNDFSTAQVMEVVNTKGIWRLVRSDQR